LFDAQDECALLLSEMPGLRKFLKWHFL
jgi:hypothetical protein